MQNSNWSGSGSGIVLAHRMMDSSSSSSSSSSTSTCPFCHLTFPLHQLQSHANSHFDDEPQQMNSQEESSIDAKISCLIGAQIRSKFYYVNDGLMSLLRNCLELDQNNTLTYLSPYVDHFESYDDVGWGCGWRNIQMLASYLLSQRKHDATPFLFGGCDFVPDISSLQRWLELAWERGFDTAGSNHFNKTVYGSTKWIGTTECAALFRSFGFRARIVDFGPKHLESLFLSVPATSSGGHVKGKGIQVSGPMDRYLIPMKHELASAPPVANDMEYKCGTKSEGHQILMDWVWNYFSDRTSTIYGQGRVIVTDRSPLYFQHDGHSRTIVGIQAKNQQNRIRQYDLLILDPVHRTAALERSLKENIGWKKLIKRGVHTLKKPMYQLCYIDPGIANEEEMEQLKTIDSIFITL